MEARIPGLTPLRPRSRRLTPTWADDKEAAMPDIPDVQQVTDELQEVVAHLQRVFESLGLPWPPPK